LSFRRRSAMPADCRQSRRGASAASGLVDPPARQWHNQAHLSHESSIVGTLLLRGLHTSRVSQTQPVVQPGSSRLLSLPEAFRLRFFHSVAASSPGNVMASSRANMLYKTVYGALLDTSNTCLI